MLENLSSISRLEAFYSGGTVSAGASGSRIVTPLGNVCTVVNVESSADIKTIGNSDKEDTPITSVHLSGDGSHVVVAYQNLLLKHWYVETGHCLTTWKSYHRAPVLVMDALKNIANDSTLLITGSADRTCRVWSVEQHTCTHAVKGFEGIITVIVFHEDTVTHARVLMVGDGSGLVKILNGETFNMIASFNDHTSSVTSIVLTPSLRRLVTSARDSVINVYNTCEDIHVPPVLAKTVAVFEPVEAVTPYLDEHLVRNMFPQANSKDCLALFTATGFKVWDTKSGNLVRDMVSYDSQHQVSQVTTTKDGSSCLVVLNDLQILVYDLTHSGRLRLKQRLVGSNDEVLDVTFLPGTVDKFIVASNTPQARIYSRATMRTDGLLDGHTDTILGVDVCKCTRGDASENVKDEALIATCSKDNTIRLWSNGTNQNKDSNDKNKDDKENADKNSSERIEKGFACIGIASGHTGSVTGVRFSKLPLVATGFLASVSGDETLKIWDTSALAVLKSAENKVGQELPHLHTLATVVAHRKDITCVDISPNDKLIATGSMDKSVKIWSVAVKQKPRVGHLELSNTLVGHHRGVWDVKFSPMDQVVATASGDCTLKIFALADGSCVRSFEGHDSAALKVNFLPSGQQLISADTSGLIKLWMIKSSECIKTIDAHDGKIWCLNVDASGEYVISGGSDAKVVVWKDCSEQDRATKTSERNKELEEEQRLSNLMEQKSYRKALRLAIRLNRPHSAYTIIKSATTAADAGTGTGHFDLVAVLSGLSDSDVRTLLEFAAKWNTNGRHSTVAQAVLNAIFKAYTPRRLLDLPESAELVESLMVYSERHFDRATRLRQQAAFVDYTWRAMRHGVAADSD